MFKEFIYPENFREGLASYLRFTGQLGKRIAGADWIRLLSEKWTPLRMDGVLPGQGWSSRGH